MSDDKKDPPYPAPYDYADGELGSVFSTDNPIIAQLYSQYQSCYKHGSYMHVYLSAQVDALCFTIGRDEKNSTPETLSHKWNAHTAGIYVTSINLSKPFNDEMFDNPINFYQMKSFSDLRRHLKTGAASEQNLLTELSHAPMPQKSNMPPALLDEDASGHIPRLASKWATQKARDKLAARCDQANISLVMDGGVPMSQRFKAPKYKPGFLNIASSDPDGQKGTLKKQYEEYAGIPMELAIPANAFETFLESDNHIFIVYHSQNGTGYGPVMPGFKTPEEARRDIEERRSYIPIMVLNRDTSFADQIKGKYISITHARKHPVITHGTLPDEKTAIANKDEWMNRPAPDFWR